MAKMASASTCVMHRHALEHWWQATSGTRRRPTKAPRPERLVRSWIEPYGLVWEGGRARPVGRLSCRGGRR